MKNEALFEKLADAIKKDTKENAQNIADYLGLKKSEDLKSLKDFLSSGLISDEQKSLLMDLADHRRTLPQKTEQETSGKVFVSMCMNKKKYDFIEDVRKGLKKGIEDSGNIPYFIDKDVYNENMIVHLFNQIEACRFFVADFTTQNTGVYYEAGYARALGKTTIFTCRADDFANVHFDIQQIHFIIWKDPDDLAQRLTDYIVFFGLGERTE